MNNHRWYADHLAAALWRSNEHMPYRLDTRSGLQEPPRFLAYGVGTTPQPRLLTTTAPPARTANVAGATITITGTQYHAALGSLSRDQWSAWFNWLTSDAPIPLYKRHGGRIARGDNTSKQEQDAAMVIMRYAEVEQWS